MNALDEESVVDDAAWQRRMARAYLPEAIEATEDALVWCVVEVLAAVCDAAAEVA